VIAFSTLKSEPNPAFKLVISSLHFGKESI